MASSVDFFLFTQFQVLSLNVQLLLLARKHRLRSLSLLAHSHYSFFKAFFLQIGPFKGTISAKKDFQFDFKIHDERIKI